MLKVEAVGVMCRLLVETGRGGSLARVSIDYNF